MKHTKLMQIALWLCMFFSCTLVASADPDPNYHIYLCWGQSNMEGNATVPDAEKKNVDARFRMFYTANDCSECGHKKGQQYTAIPPLARCFHWNNSGFGPVDYFGRTLVENLDKNIKVGVCVVACGGASIELFQKSEYQRYLTTCADWLKGYANSYGGNPYGRLIEVAKEAQKVGVIKGILVHQGETNTGNPNWPTYLKGVYEDMLNDLGLDGKDVPLLVGEVRYTGPCSGHNNTIRTVPNVIPNSYVISAKDCEASGDDYHFSVNGYKLLGKRYAEKMLELLEKNGSSTPQQTVSVAAMVTKESEPGEVEIYVKNEIENIKGIDVYADGKLIASDESKVVWENVSSGTHSVWAVAHGYDGKDHTSEKVEVSIFVPQTPYNGFPAKIPGTIEAEEFDYGGEGNAYHDKDEQNRNKGDRNEGVDMSNTAIGYSEVGEWIEYTVEVEEEAEYILESKVATGANGSAFTLYLDGLFIIPGEDGTPGGFVKLPNTGDWNTYTTVETKLNKLPKGVHILKLEITGDWVDLDCMTFRKVGDPASGINLVPSANVVPDGDYMAYDASGKFVKNVSIITGVKNEQLSKGFYVLRSKEGKSYSILIRK